MGIKPIKNDRDHDNALQEVQALWGAKPGTPKGDRLDVLVTLIEAYERLRFPVDPPDPIDAIRFRLEQQGLGPSALIGVVGSRTRVYEVLRGDRPLTLLMIRKLHANLGIPADVLIRPGVRKTRRAA
jgi:HTH-type transcriptional regulator/antitoxin HigA